MLQACGMIDSATHHCRHYFFKKDPGPSALAISVWVHWFASRTGGSHTQVVLKKVWFCPSHSMLLLGPLTPAECMRPGHPWAYPEGRVPVRLSVFARKGVFFVKHRQRWMSLCRHAETLTVHAHGHCGLHRLGEGAVAGVTFQLPPVVWTQSGDPETGNRDTERKKKSKGIKESLSWTVKKS